MVFLIAPSRLQRRGDALEPAPENAAAQIQHG
jgi:hypothetical protein